MSDHHADDVQITETTVGWLGEVRVPFGNVWEADYVRADGVAARGLTGVLFLPDGEQRVGAGSQVRAGDGAWVVHAIEGEPPRAVITLRPVALPIDEVARQTQEALMRHIAANTADEDERREAERDARIKAALDQLAREGKLPPRMSKP